MSSGIFFLYRFQLNRRLAEVETKRLRELDTLKTQLYTNITHEFRTPLTLIQGPVERALQNPSYTLARTDLERIRQNCRRLLHLLRQMLHLSKLEMGALRPDYTYGNVLPTVKYIVDSFASFAASQEIQLQLRSPEDPIMMDYDQKKLVDILANLVSNAIKFTLAGGSVTVGVEPPGHASPSHLLIKVKDTGSGTPKEALDKIFDRFYQADSKFSKSREETISGGSGIGLSLSKKLAELMDGSISVKSKPGKGSTFSLRLPIRSTQKEVRADVPFPDVYIPRTIPALSETDITRDFPGAPKGPSVLIVEDNTDVANFVADLTIRPIFPGFLPPKSAKRQLPTGKNFCNGTDFSSLLLIARIIQASE